MERTTVLVVDDHSATRMAYAAFLRDRGFRTLEAAHGGEAILHAHRHRPEVALLDISMPVLDGVETAESLRACPATAHMRILAVTGSDSLLQKARMQTHCDALLLKPCDPQELLSRILSLVVPQT